MPPLSPQITLEVDASLTSNAHTPGASEPIWTNTAGPPKSTAGRFVCQNRQTLSILVHTAKGMSLLETLINPGKICAATIVAPDRLG